MKKFIILVSLILTISGYFQEDYKVKLMLSDIDSIILFCFILFFVGNNNNEYWNNWNKKK